METRALEGSPVTNPQEENVRAHPLEIYRSSWALVTGAAREEGLGFAYARQLAEHGLNLVLVDILNEELEVRAKQLRDVHGVEARTVAADLGDLAAYQRIDDATQDVTIDVLICDHMYTPADTPTILDMDLAEHNRMIDINARAYANLIHVFGNKMKTRRRGAIVIVSSGAGLVPTPFTGAYAANKAFQIALGEALWYEVRSSGVDVVVMVAGLMDTQGEVLSRYPQWLVADPNDAAAETLSVIGRKHVLFPGRVNRMFLLVQTRLLSRRAAVTQIGGFMARGLGKT